MEKYLSATELIRSYARKQGITDKKLAELTNQTQQNISNKMKRNNMTEAEIRKYAEALGCSVKIVLVDDETGEEFYGISTGRTM